MSLRQLYACKSELQWNQMQRPLYIKHKTTSSTLDSDGKGEECWSRWKQHLAKWAGRHHWVWLSTVFPIIAYTVVGCAWQNNWSHVDTTVLHSSALVHRCAELCYWDCAVRIFIWGHCVTFILAKEGEGDKIPLIASCFETQNIDVSGDLFTCTGLASASVNLELFNFTSGSCCSLLL